jgi:stage V sporulation protein G
MKLKATINRLLEKGNTKAIASLTVDDAYAVHGIKVIEGKSGTFISMPSVKQPDGKFRETFHAVTAEARQQMNDTIMQAYEQKLAEQNADQDMDEVPEPEDGPVMSM